MKPLEKIALSVSLTLALITLPACDPVSLMMGGTATVGTAATREKGLSSAFSDSWISTKIKKNFYSFNPELHSHVGINVQNGEVLLVGAVPNETWVQEAESMAKAVDGVSDVFNHITVQEDGKISLGEIASDSLITTELKSHLFCDGNIKSLNYSIKTSAGIIYIMGYGQNEEEVEKVLNYARNIKGVQKVVSYVKLKEEAKPNTKEENSTAPDSSQ